MPLHRGVTSTEIAFRIAGVADTKFIIFMKWRMRGIARVDT